MLKQAIKCTNCFKSVSVPSRMTIYNFLNGHGGDVTVGQIVDEVGLTQPTVSYHLKEMRESGLLKSKKQGKEVFYSINELCPHFQTECVLHSLKFPEVKNA